MFAQTNFCFSYKVENEDTEKPPSGDYEEVDYEEDFEVKKKKKEICCEILFSPQFHLFLVHFIY